MAKIERRFYKVGEQVDLRAGKAGPDERRQIRGHAAVFNSMSGDLGGFREEIAPGAFSNALDRGDDVRALYNHDPNHVLGRSKSGTLRMHEDEVGLAVEIDMPETVLGRDLYHLIERGDVSQMSFGFIVHDEEWEKRDGLPVRIVRDVELFDVSPVTYPAYPATDVAVRSALPEESQARLAEIERDEEDPAPEAAPSHDLKNKRLELAEKE